MTIRSDQEAINALDAVEKYLLPKTRPHPADCKCMTCEACGHAGDASFCLSRIKKLDREAWEDAEASAVAKGKQ